MKTAKHLTRETIIANKIKENFDIEDGNKLHTVVYEALEEIDSIKVIKNKEHNDTHPLNKFYSSFYFKLVFVMALFIVGFYFGTTWQENRQSEYCKGLYSKIRGLEDVLERCEEN